MLVTYLKLKQNLMIITSLLDTDLYKLTMMQLTLHQFPSAIVEYQFRCRNPDNEMIDLTQIAEQLEAEIHDLCQLKFTQAELDYLRQFSFFKEDFINFLKIFQLQKRFITIDTTDGFKLSIKGPWLHTILFEVPMLATISELYFKKTIKNPDFTEGKKRLTEKHQLLADIKSDVGTIHFSEFGTRRRFSKDWQHQVTSILKQQFSTHLLGTSNVMMAMKYDLKPIGTMAHEYLQAHQALGPRLIDSQKVAFDNWSKEYRGELGIALSDVCGLNAFLNDFDLYFCKLFDGARHDSGDPFEWGERIIEHYIKHKIDPKTKTLVFSDKLDFETVIQLNKQFHQRTNPVYGIGTYLTNDLSYTPLDIVIKMVACNDQPVAKVSDSPGKTMCPDLSYLDYLKKVFHIEQ